MAEDAPTAVVAEEAKADPKSEGVVGEKSEGYSKKKEKSKAGGKGGMTKIDGHRLNVKNLSADMKTDELKKLFEPFGAVVAAEVKFKDDGSSRNFGFVIFSSEEDSKKATAELNDKELGGKKLSVGPAERREEDGKKGKGDSKGLQAGGKGGKTKIDGHRLNVKNLSADMKTEELKNFFEPFGTVVAAEVKLKDDGSSRNFGFVIFSSEEDSKKATAELNDKEVGGKKLSVGPAERREDDGKKGKGDGKGVRNRAPSGPFGGGGGFRLNVKNMAWDITAEKLKELFAPFGEVSDAQVKLKESGKSRGFGFVILPTEEAAKKAIAEMHDKEVEGKKLNVAPAERRQDEDDAANHGMVFPAGKDMSKKEKDMYQAAYMQQMMLMQNQAMMMAWGSAAYGQKEYEGVLTRMLAPGRHQRHKKDEETAKGHGFIECAETHAIYGADIYADRSVLPKDAAVGSKLKFTVIANYGEHPKAATAKIVAA